MTFPDIGPGLKAAMPQLRGRLLANQPLADSAWFRVGGPAQALFMSAQALAALEVPVEWHLSHGIGHGIDQEGLRHGGSFLARRFAG